MSVHDAIVKAGEINEPHSVRCHLALIKEVDGSFSAIVLNLPGVGSCGETEDEAVENVREAVVGVISSYRDDDEEVPWLAEVRDVPPGAKLTWISVNV